MRSLQPPMGSGDLKIRRALYRAARNERSWRRSAMRRVSRQNRAEHSARMLRYMYGCCPLLYRTGQIGLCSMQRCYAGDSLESPCGRWTLLSSSEEIRSTHQRLAEPAFQLIWELPSSDDATSILPWLNTDDTSTNSSGSRP